MVQAQSRGMPRALLFILVAIVVLMIGSLIATIAVSAHFGVADGYIPPEERSSPTR
ncbi:MAG: hypothetical protein IT378_25490 [Sandaracinaceae bacterium]|nr:hypothetical protein [Sandaracinaceae bacterium]